MLSEKNLQDIENHLNSIESPHKEVIKEEING